MERVMISTYIPAELAQKIAQLARDQNASVSRTIENILRKEASVIPAAGKGKE